MSFTFRMRYEEFNSDVRLQESVLNTSAFVLGLSLSDVRSYKLKAVSGAVEVSVEVVSPFLLREEADAILIDNWFGAFEVPVDKVVSHTWDEMHPPVPPLPVEPVLPVWAMALIASLIGSIVVLCPVQCCYFRRLANTRRRYKPHMDDQFVDKIVNRSPPWLIRLFVGWESGSSRRISSDGEFVDLY